MNIAKTKQQARFFLFCTAAAAGAFLLWTLSSVLSMDFSLLSPASFLYGLPATFFSLLCAFHAFLLLHSVAKEETPFLPRNISHLQWIGWLFVAYEPVYYLCQSLTNTFFPIRFGNGFHMTTTQSYGGIFLISGFAILTVATIFRYGMELQQLSDETL